MITINKITHTSTRRYTFVIADINDSKADHVSVLGKDLNLDFVEMEILYKTADSNEAEEQLVKRVKASENDPFFVGVSKTKEPKKKEVKESKPNSNSTNSKKNKTKFYSSSES